MNLKKYRTSVILLACLCWHIVSIAQTNPGTENLVHQWTFDNGTANDNVASNPVNGELRGGATISNKTLLLSGEGQYLSFSGSALAMNTYDIISQELWFTPRAGANTGFAHIVYFGTTVGNDGYNYLYTMPVRGDNRSRVGISDASISNTIYVSGPEYDDGELHHFVSVVRYDSLFFYIDGELVDQKPNSVPLSAISTDMAYLGKSGFTADPTWQGSISKYSIYNKSLSQSEVQYLYEIGAEEKTTIIPSESSIFFPEHSSRKVAIWAQSLSQDIAISASNGFSVSPNSLPASTIADSITITYEGSESMSGTVYIESGNIKKTIAVEGSVDPSIYISTEEIVLDEINTTASFIVTGYNLANEIMMSAPAGISFSPNVLPANASRVEVTVTYDGNKNSSGKIYITSGKASRVIELTAMRTDECFVELYPGNLITDPNLNFDDSGEGIRSINTNADYVFCGSSSGTVSGGGRIERDLTGKLKPNTEYRVRAKVYKYSPEIKPGNMGNVTYTLDLDKNAYPEYYRLISEAMDSACAYFNKYTPFVHDIYVYYSDGIPTAQASHLGAIGFGSNTTYMWVGTAIHEMAHYFGSGTSTYWRELMSTKVWAGEVASSLVRSINGETLKGDTQHFWPFGINYRSEVTDLGSQENQHQALIHTTKVIKAMLIDDCNYASGNSSFAGIGISGWNGSSSDLYQDVTAFNKWQEIDFTFTTGSNLNQTQKIYFTSEMGYIDNWEMYEVKEESYAEVNLEEGWNLVSLPITAFNMSVASVFPNATVVKDMESFYRTDQSPAFNTLVEIEESKGYFVYNSVNETLQFTGVSLIDEIKELDNLNGTWKLIGSPWLEAVKIEDALGNSAWNVEVVKSFDNYWKPNGMNGIEYIESGKGYFVK